MIRLWDKNAHKNLAIIRIKMQHFMKNKSVAQNIRESQSAERDSSKMVDLSTDFAFFTSIFPFGSKMNGFNGMPFA